MADDISEVPCPLCGARRLGFGERLEAAPVGSHSLAGVQDKVTARPQLVLECGRCGCHGPATVTFKDDGSDRVDVAVSHWERTGG